jgi:hypothetical protein
MMQRLTIPTASGQGTDSDAWWKMAATREAALAVQVAVDATWIALDPVTTSPHVTIAVLVGNGVFALSPGAVLPIPRGAAVRIYNPQTTYMNGLYFTAALVVQQLGRVGLVCGDDAALPAWLAYANRQTSSWPKASYLAAGYVIPGGPTDSILVPSNNLRGMRISLRPGDAGGVALPLPMVAPGWSASFRPIVAEFPGALDAAVGNDVLDIAPLYGSGYDYTQNTAGDVAIVNATNAEYRDYAITVPTAAVGIKVLTQGGAGVACVMFTITGY